MYTAQSESLQSSITRLCKIHIQFYNCYARSPFIITCQDKTDNRLIDTNRCIETTDFWLENNSYDCHVKPRDAKRAIKLNTQTFMISSIIRQ